MLNSNLERLLQFLPFQNCGWEKFDLVIHIVKNYDSLSHLDMVGGKNTMRVNLISSISFQNPVRDELMVTAKTHISLSSVGTTLPSQFGFKTN